MFLKTNTYLLVCLLCSLSLWCKSTSAGSSFLSPSQKPQFHRLCLLQPSDVSGDVAHPGVQSSHKTPALTHLKKTAADTCKHTGSRGKSSRVGRQVLEEAAQPTEDAHITVSAPFEIAITMTTEDLEEYGVMLQEFIRRLLGNTEPEEKPH